MTIATLSPTATTFQVGDHVRIDNPACDPGWNTTGVVVGRDHSDFLVGLWYFVIPDDGPYAGIRGSFRIDNLERIETYTVDTDEGMDALPIGTILEDIDSDQITKFEDGWAYTCLDGEEVEDQPIFPASEFSDYSPYFVVNPEVLDEPATETFEVGDLVNVLNRDGLYYDDFEPGDKGIVEDVCTGPLLSGLYFVRFLKDGETKYVQDNQMTHAEADEVVEDADEDDALDVESFKIGDLVRVLNGDRLCYDDFEPGDKGIVEDVMGGLFYVRFSKDDEARFVQAKQMTHVEAEESEDEAIYTHDGAGFEALPIGSVAQETEDGSLVARVDGGYAWLGHSRSASYFETVLDVFPCDYMDDHEPMRVLFVAPEA